MSKFIELTPELESQLDDLYSESLRLDKLMKEVLGDSEKEDKK
tara:strand:- start:1167 stop:1295 length:129 start_codon:yes stop_codon:yes gene_type:complete